ncbi:hypothetical protein WJX81_005064 [Elliptochloris bilobata]|uniref:RWP-RK domain-containing protein n=1 Tax=Elliptochloris bilobata TaxID=381761 RepID=A0AAW1RN65_9CHLO
MLSVAYRNNGGQSLARPRLLERLGHALASFNYRLTLSGSSSLAQLWLPEHAPDGSLVLNTQGLPYSVSGSGDLLALFRCISCRYKFSTDVTKLNTGAVGRVFVSGEPELSHNVQTYDKSVYLRVADAQRCKVAATLLMPLYETELREHPFGVFEVCQSEKNVLFPSLVDMLRECLAAVSLWTVDVDKHSMSVGLRSWPRDFDCSGLESASAAKQGHAAGSGAAAGGRGEAETHCSADSMHKASNATGRGSKRSGEVMADSDDGGGRRGSGKRPSPSSSVPSCGNEAAVAAAAAAAEASAAQGGRLSSAPEPPPAAEPAGLGTGGAGSRGAGGFTPTVGGGPRLVQVENRLELNWAGDSQLHLPASQPWAPQQQCKFEALPAGPFGATAAVPEMPAFLNAVFDSHVAHMSQGPPPGSLGGTALAGDALGGGPLGAQQRASDAFGSGWAPSGGVEGLGLDFEDDDDCTMGSQDAGSLEGGLHNNRTAGGAGKRLSLAELQAHFNLGLREAANRLGICPTTLKRACRRHGIQRWPRRQLAKLSRADTASACDMLRPPSGDWHNEAPLPMTDSTFSGAGRGMPPPQRPAGREALDGMASAMRTASQPLPAYVHAVPVRTLSCNPAPGMQGAPGSVFPLGGGAPHSHGLVLHRSRSQLDDIMW